MSTNWMLSEQLVDDFLHELKLEHFRRFHMTEEKSPVVEADTLISYDTFCNTYNRMDPDFRMICPKTVFAFSNNGAMEARYDDLTENLQKLVYYYEDYNELCYCGGEFSEYIEFETLLNIVQQNYLEKYKMNHPMMKQEYDDWKDFVFDYIRLMLNPFNRTEILVSDVLENEILVQLRNVDSISWMMFETVKIFYQRFREAASRSEFAKCQNFLVQYDFHYLNVLDDTEHQPYTTEFVNRLFEYLGSQQKLKKGQKPSTPQEYRMDFRTFVNLRRMLSHRKTIGTRQFLFDIIDLKGDGLIDVDEVRYFYNGLLRLHRAIDINNEAPFATFTEFYISWFDQIKPEDNCLEKTLSFEDIKNHNYGSDCLMMLINYDSLAAFDRRFELGADPMADTLFGEEDKTPDTSCNESNNFIKECELEDLLGPAVLTDRTNVSSHVNSIENSILQFENSPILRRTSL